MKSPAVRAGNLHDAGWFGALGGSLTISAGQISGQAGQNAGKRRILLIFSCLSYAFLTLLRRNIVAFQAGGHPYFPIKQITGGNAGFTRKRTDMFANLVRAIRQWKRYNQSLTELSRLGDRELADIGISRSDIPRVAWNATHRG
jgi:uncharacterized protein YjiS (DUF1127 family)